MSKILEASGIPPEKRFCSIGGDIGLCTLLIGIFIVFLTQTEPDPSLSLFWGPGFLAVGIFATVCFQVGNRTIQTHLENEVDSVLKDLPNTYYIIRDFSFPGKLKTLEGTDDPVKNHTMVIGPTGIFLIRYLRNSQVIDFPKERREGKSHIKHIGLLDHMFLMSKSVSQVKKFLRTFSNCIFPSNHKRALSFQIYPVIVCDLSKTDSSGFRKSSSVPILSPIECKKHILSFPEEFYRYECGRLAYWLARCNMY